MDPEERSRLQKMLDTAPKLEPDLEDRLMELKQAQDRKYVPQPVQDRYEELRDKIAPELLERGPRYFLNANGEKVFAYTVQPMLIDISLAKLRSARDNGEITQAAYDAVVKEVIDRDAFARAVRKGAGRRPARDSIPPKVFARVAREVPRTAYIRFITESSIEESLGEDW